MNAMAKGIKSRIQYKIVYVYLMSIVVTHGMIRLFFGLLLDLLRSCFQFNANEKIIKLIRWFKTCWLYRQHPQRMYGKMYGLSSENIRTKPTSIKFYSMETLLMGSFFPFKFVTLDFDTIELTSISFIAGSKIVYVQTSFQKKIYLRFLRYLWTQWAKKEST